MALTLKQPLALRALLVDLVDVDLLVPAADREEVVLRRELQVGYAVRGELALRDFNVLAGVAGGGATRLRGRGAEKRHCGCRVLWVSSRKLLVAVVELCAWLLCRGTGRELFMYAGRPNGECVG
jgi:hypothetical protein